MELNKAYFNVDENHLSLNMPFTKVNKETRTVSGYATLDNVDRQGDVVTAEASKAAFSAARGNIREQHSSLAVGKMVDFKEDSFYDADTQKFYNGVYVTAYISKGAQDTWEKVLDGTLSGFSIGGNITDSETQWVKDAGANVRFVKSYDLIELSLVDNPANQFANVFSIQKSDQGTFVKGMITEISVENVFWCVSDKIANVTKSDCASCSVCDKDMLNIGFFESGEPREQKVTEVVSKFLDQKVEGGVNMSEPITKSEAPAEGVITTEPVAPAAPVEPTEPVKVDETAPVVEAPKEEDVAKAVVHDETAGNDLSKMFDDLKVAVDQSLEKSQSLTEEAVSKVEDKIHEINKSFEDKVSAIEAKFDELKQNLDGMKSSSDEVSKRLELLEGATAIRKSNEVESLEAKTIKKNSVWNGTFLPVEDLDD
jgi:hypothetical protein